MTVTQKIIDETKKNLEEISDSFEDYKKEQENRKTFIYGLILGLAFGILGNLIILVLDKLFINNFNRTNLFLTLTIILIIFFVFIIFFHDKILKYRQEIKSIDKLEKALMPALNSAVKIKEKELIKNK